LEASDGHPGFLGGQHEPELGLVNPLMGLSTHGEDLIEESGTQCQDKLQLNDEKVTGHFGHLPVSLIVSAECRNVQNTQDPFESAEVGIDHLIREFTADVQSAQRE
jgi:hypothetical protein